MLCLLYSCPIKAVLPYLYVLSQVNNNTTYFNLLNTANNTNILLPSFNLGTNTTFYSNIISSSVSVSSKAIKICVANISSNNVALLTFPIKTDSTTTTPTTTIQTIPTIQIISVGTQPVPVATTSSGKYIYVGNYGDGTISIIDTTQKVPTVTKTLTVQRHPTAIAFSGQNAYVVTGGDPVAGFGNPTVIVIDTSSQTVVNIIEVGRGACAIDFYGQYAYITNRSDNTVSVIDIASQTVVNTITVGSQPKAISVYGQYVYVVNASDTFSPGSISVIDPTSQSVINTIAVGKSPSFFNVSPDGKLGYVPQVGGISVIDLTSLKIVKVITAADATLNTPVAFSPNGNYAYLGCSFSIRGHLYVIDTSNLAIVQQFSLPHYSPYTIVSIPNPPQQVTTQTMTKQVSPSKSTKKLSSL